MAARRPVPHTLQRSLSVQAEALRSEPRTGRGHESPGQSIASCTFIPKSRTFRITCITAVETRKPPGAPTVMKSFPSFRMIVEYPVRLGRTRGRDGQASERWRFSERWRAAARRRRNPALPLLEVSLVTAASPSAAPRGSASRQPDVGDFCGREIRAGRTITRGFVPDKPRQAGNTSTREWRRSSRRLHLRPARPRMPLRRSDMPPGAR